MKPKKTILILCDWFLPGYLAGGPIQSIATLTAHLGNDIYFKIITTDRDFKEEKPYANIKINEWTSFEGRTVFYVSADNLNAKFILNLISNTPHDVIYLNSLFSKYFSVLPLKWKQQGLIKSDVVLAPRGMLRNAALAVKPIKKKIFLVYAKVFGLFNNIHWQSTSTHETEEIKQRIGKTVLLSQVSNLPSTINSVVPITKTIGQLKLCFIARIVDIKNLNFAINVLKQITNINITYDIYGPKEDLDYWNTCEINAKQLPSNITFNYKGSIKSTDVEQVINNYHALFLPTQTENFGHVIVQTLLQGRPVIISNNTPWRNLATKNAGFDIDLNNTELFIKAIQTLANLNQNEFNLSCNAALAYISQQLNVNLIKDDYLKLFTK